MSGHGREEQPDAPTTEELDEDSLPGCGHLGVESEAEEAQEQHALHDGLGSVAIDQTA